MEQENNVKSRFKSVCVYCGSSYGKRDCYREAAVELGQELGKQRLDLVYGGGGIGLMGLVARTVHGSGGRVQGIIPKALIGKEKTGETVGELTVVVNMHQRKAEMARHADCFIALPGGYGTMEELLEVIRWAQLGIHDKPVGLLNVDGYYNHLLTFIDKAVEDGFIKPSRGHIYVSAPNAKELVQKLEDKSCGEVPLQPLPPPPSIGASDTENTIGESSAAAVPESVQLPLQPPPPLLDDTSIHPPPPSEVAPAKRRRSGPCYGWIESDEEDGDLELIDLPPMVMMMKRRDVKPGDV